MDEIAVLLGVPRRQVSRGSSEPKLALLDLVTALKLPISPALQKPQLAEAIARYAGLDWGQEHDSRHTASGGGGTVTFAGLQRVREAVRLFVGRRERNVAEGAQLGRPYRHKAPPPTSQPVVFERDPEAFDRSSAAHRSLENRLAEALRGFGIEPLDPDYDAGDPPFDLAWRAAGGLFLCEVKSTTSVNQRLQVRLGIGQLLEYGARLLAGGKGSVTLVLAVERSLQAVEFRTCDYAAVRTICGPSLATDLRQLVEGRDPPPPLR